MDNKIKKIPYEKIELWTTNENDLNVKIFQNEDNFRKYSKTFKDKKILVDILIE